MYKRMPKSIKYADKTKNENEVRGQKSLRFFARLLMWVTLVVEALAHLSNSLRFPETTAITVTCKN